MEWTNSSCLKLVGLYREREVLWNPVHKDYKNKIKKIDAWDDISKIMKGDTGEVKKKMESLLTSFRRERQKQDNSFKTGAGTDTIFKSSWFAFKDMLFLMDKFIPKETKNTDEMVRPRSQYQEEEEEEEKEEGKGMTNDDVAVDEVDNDTQVTEVPERTTLKRKSDFKSPKVKRVTPVASVNLGTSSAISRGQEAYQILQETIASKKTRDDSTIFGEYVAAKHKKYSTHTQSEVEHLIGDILYKADKGFYESRVSSISSINQKKYYLNQPNQHTYTSITPSTTSNPYKHYSSDTQSTSTPLTSPSASDGPLSYENESFVSEAPSNLTLQQPDNSTTPIISFINAFTNSL